MFRRFSIGKRIYFLLFVMIVFVAGVILAFLSNSLRVAELGVSEVQEVMIKDHKDRLYVATHSMALAVGEAVRGAATPEEQVEIIRRLVDPIRFEEDKSGYYFVYRGTINVALPIKKEAQGKDLSQTKDVNGVYFVRELDRLAKAGGGYLTWVFPKPGQGDQPKLGYAEMIPGTDMWIGTGVYIDNVDSQKAVIANDLQGETKSFTYVLLTALAIIFLVAVLPLCLLIIRSIVQPLRQTTDAANEMATGNLDVTLDARGHDETAMLQSALVTMVRRLKENIQDLRLQEEQARLLTQEAEKAAQEARDAGTRAEKARHEGLCHATERLEGAINAISQASERIDRLAGTTHEATVTQRMRIGETATAIEEMNATVLEVARNASQAASDADASRGKASEGEQEMAHSLKAMEALKVRTETLKDNMHGLGRRAEAVGQVMNVITDIADQTNLLALNAAIEAARAGEAGRGFAVVADEVRKLAEKTMAATKEVGATIQAIQQETRRNMTDMDEAASAILSMAEMSTNSGKSLSEIVQLIDRAAGQVQAIAAATQQQSAASEEINKSIEEVNSLADATAGGMEEAASAIQELTRQTRELMALLDDLKRENATCSL
ncbi:methyl-accepting chemotaxis sensory transducer with Cache sensor [Desulfocurvibacter africanus PCS]|uniref:Methyl-accepting chemotaxis sensory transducer with Cache sensor n=2 Tax=Desulfocurvibacter africanus TaxID=873 RepID=M5Q2K2_DESAF|nr:methyl-accepting chemotaxis protein [Desulfocurvibacter africanus]EMG37483.1 methyl-accepting chemotaxis sensory transducer with Cache sensor [Desulfocurvibacter africanus PCS]